MDNTNEDVKTAQRIIEGSKLNINKNKSFHNDSFIYKFSNENISNYFKYLLNKQNILEVISSGDQILNSVLGNSFNIDGFDISRFPRYFLSLKIAAIKTISKDDYTNLFIEDNNSDNDYYDDLYDLIKKELDEKDKLFWNYLFNFYDWTDIYNSNLFSTEPYNKQKVIENNPYLQTDNYLKLRDKLNKLNLNIYINDISNLIKTLSKKYDLVNLSNIIYYKDLKEYYELLKNINLQDNGLILTYIYKLSVSKKENFQNNNLHFEQFENSDSGVLIYRK